LMHPNAARHSAAVLTLPRPGIDPAVGVAVTLLGCFLTFHLIGLLLIPVGIWLFKRSQVS